MQYYAIQYIIMQYYATVSNTKKYHANTIIYNSCNIMRYDKALSRSAFLVGRMNH